MEGGAAYASIGVLFQNLIDVSKDEISLIRGLKRDAEKLRVTLTTIQISLDDAQKKYICDDAVKAWLKKLEQVSFDADNVLDQLAYQRLSKMNTTRTNWINQVPSCFPYFNHYALRRDMAVRIKEIITTFETIDKWANNLGLATILVDAPAAASGTVSETDSVTVDPIFIGRDNDVSEIVKMLTRPTKQGLTILPIVGMGGLGKTTLARNVFNHQKTRTHFGQHIWVHVSQEFDAGILLKKILTNLIKRSVEDESREVVMKKLQEALGGKTYLLVIDDFRNQDRKNWEDFINSWSGVSSTKGNGIIVTTRNTEVGWIVRTSDIHHLNCLSEEQCWFIIKDRAFKGGHIPSGQIEAIGRNIAERCKGLPLAANVVGGMLRDKSHEEWLSIEENWSSDIGGDESDISKILKLSFHYLSSPSLKKCFAYCSIFPKGARIEKVQLIELWMAEGFLQASDMEDVGKKVVNILLQNSLLQVVDRDEYGNVKHCSMHNLVHDVAGSILGFLTLNDNILDDMIHQSRYISWESNRDIPNPIPKEQAKWLRALLYEGKTSEIIFSDFKSLHVLTLSDLDVEELPVSIRELIHLRYLDISHTFVEYLPNSIGELYHLQTFRALTWASCTRFPRTLKYLFNLRHLHVHDTAILPPQMGKLTSLQTLEYFKVGDEGHRIVELESLKNLKGELKIDNLEKVRGEEESLKACLFEKSGIVKLVLRWGESREGEIKDVNVLRGLQPHSNLKILQVIGFNGATFPSWTLEMVGLNKLMEVRLESCLECEGIPMLGHLPRLKSLYLSNLKNVKSIDSSFYGIDSCNNGVCTESITSFPALERLELLNMPNLTTWAEAEISSDAPVQVFPCLAYLKIIDCRKLSSAPSQFACLKELDVRNMDSDLPLANIFGTKLCTLVTLRIGYMDGLTSLPDWLFHNNRQLYMLEIYYCPNLRLLPGGLDSLNSLEELMIVDCKSLSYPVSDRLAPLRRLAIWGWNFPGLALLRGVSNSVLRRLSISGSQFLMNVLGEMVESRAPLLEELNIMHWDLSDSMDLASYTKGVNGIMLLDPTRFIHCI